MKTFQTQTASWKLDGKKLTITQYAGSKIMGKVELHVEDMAEAVEVFWKMTEEEKNNG